MSVNPVGALILVAAAAGIGAEIDAASQRSGYAIRPSSPTSTQAAAPPVAIAQVEPMAIAQVEPVAIAQVEPVAIAQVEPVAIGGGGADVEQHPAISRTDLAAIIQAGGGINPDGSFVQPIVLNWGYMPSAPIVRMPHAWAPHEATLLTVQNGAYVAIDFETGAW